MRINEVLFTMEHNHIDCEKGEEQCITHVHYQSISNLFSERERFRCEEDQTAIDTSGGLKKKAKISSRSCCRDCAALRNAEAPPSGLVSAAVVFVVELTVAATAASAAGVGEKARRIFALHRASASCAMPELRGIF